MKRIWIILLMTSLAGGSGLAQVAEMNWEMDSEVFLKMANNSNYTYDIRNLFHIKKTRDTVFTSEFVFYPVNPGEDFALTLSKDTTDMAYTTLWNALHAKLGSGWVHFMNCIAYALETQMLDLREPIMQRPATDWKPDPVTDSWKRTRKWEYYIPLSRKLAIKEYKLRIKNNEAGDLANLPTAYIDLFLNTSDKQYRQLQADGNFQILAKIDLVRIMLGARYLGEEQISYLSNAVLNAVTSYTSSRLPSVLIFDEYDAAAAMSLSAEGYELESMVFRKTAELSEEEKESRKEEILGIIGTINQYNQEAFKKRLLNYYAP